ncbi:MAG TPA: SpoIIE family protein phosphatase [Melioribacteraceae bacterium]|nr:SpoIIE family protein phosphatase [Melioribacteraceae bacterium]
MAKEYDIDKLDAFSVFTTFNGLLNAGENIETVSDFMFELCIKKNRALKGMMITRTTDGWNVPFAKGFPNTEFPIAKIKDDLLMTPELKEFLEKKGLRFSYDIKFGDRLMGKVFIDRQDIINLKDKKLVVNILSYGAIYFYFKNIESELKKIKSNTVDNTEHLHLLLDLSKQYSRLSDIELINKLFAYSVSSRFNGLKYATLIFTENDIFVMDNKFKFDIVELLKEFKYTDIEFTVKEKDIKKRFKSLFEEGIGLIIPLIEKNETKGLLVVSSKLNEDEFNKYDIEYLEGLSGILINSVENINFMKDAAEKFKLEKEADIVQNIYKYLIPKNLPKIKKGDIYCTYLPAKKSYTDYYNAYFYNEEVVYFVMANSQVKGLKTQLLFNKLESAFESYAKLNQPIELFVKHVDEFMQKEDLKEGTIQLVCGSYNLPTKEFFFINTGIKYAIMVRSGKLKYLEPYALPIGSFAEDKLYTPERIKLKKNDMFIITSNTMIELTGLRNEKFAPIKFEEVALKNWLKPAEHLINIYIKNIDEYCKGNEQPGNLSIMTLKIKDK